MIRCRQAVSAWCRPRVLWLAFLGGLLAACGTVALVVPPADEAQRLALFRQMSSAPPCCKHVRELTFHPLTRGRPRDYGHDSRLPAFDLPGGRSYVAGFTLPPLAPGESLKVASVLRLGSPGLDGRSIFCPSLLLLDRDLRERGRHSCRAFSQDEGIGSRDTIALSLPAEALRHVRYLLIYFDPDDLRFGTELCGQAGMVLSEGPPRIELGAPTCIGVPFTVTGAVRLAIEPAAAPS